MWAEHLGGTSSVEGEYPAWACTNRLQNSSDCSRYLSTDVRDSAESDNNSCGVRMWFLSGQLPEFGLCFFGPDMVNVHSQTKNWYCIRTTYMGVVESHFEKL